MKVYTLDKVNINKLYFYGAVGVLVYILMMILVIYLIIKVFPEFKYVGMLFVFSSLFFGNYIYKFSYKKSTVKIQIQFNNKKIVINNEEILIENIKQIFIKSYKFSFYPRIIFNMINDVNIVFRVSKYDKDYYEFVKRLKEMKNT